MKREELDFLDDASLSKKDKIDKVMAIYGKSIATKDKETKDLQDKVDDLTKSNQSYEKMVEDFNEKSKKNQEWESMYNDLKKEMDDQKKEAERIKADEIVTKNILDAFGEKKFTSEYAKNGLVTDIKNALNLPENKGKGINDLMTELTKDKSGIFESNNKPADMPGMSDDESEHKAPTIPIVF